MNKDPSNRPLTAFKSPLLLAVSNYSILVESKFFVAITLQDDGLIAVKFGAC